MSVKKRHPPTSHQRKLFLAAHHETGVPLEVWGRNEFGNLSKSKMDFDGRHAVIRRLRAYGMSYLEIERTTGMGHGSFTHILGTECGVMPDTTGAERADCRCWDRAWVHRVPRIVEPPLPPKTQQLPTPGVQRRDPRDAEADEERVGTADPDNYLVHDGHLATDHW